MLHDTLIKILTSQMGVTIGSDYLEHTVVDSQQGHIEGTATQVVHQDVLLRLLVQAVRNGSRGGLVDNTKHVQACDGPSILGGGTLGVIEIRGHGDHSVLHLLAQVVLSSLLHLSQDHRRHLLRSQLLVLTLDLHHDHWLPIRLPNLERQQLHVLLDRLILESTADQPLDIEQCLSRVDGGLILGGLSDQTFVIGKGNIRRGDSVTLIVGDDFHPPVFVDPYAGVGGPKINPDHRAIDLLVVLVRRGGPKEGTEQPQRTHLTYWW
mmetsp:Transcript_90821/g.207895  ORF Transcript_90821/g.207895 Transcript_90821/m.207895 type:complete len:265 (-) Transcript_90821:30-824(-)